MIVRDIVIAWFMWSCPPSSGSTGMGWAVGVWLMLIVCQLQCRYWADWGVHADGDCSVQDGGARAHLSSGDCPHHAWPERNACPNSGEWPYTYIYTSISDTWHKVGIVREFSFRNANNKVIPTLLLTVMAISVYQGGHCCCWMMDIVHVCSCVMSWKFLHSRLDILFVYHSQGISDTVPKFAHIAVACIALLTHLEVLTCTCRCSILYDLRPNHSHRTPNGILF
jgi:hypothetical protein